MWTVGRLARRYGLSRTALLYYDRLGLLRPSERSAAGYRQYNEADEERLARICRYREAGLPLRRIAELLDDSVANDGALATALEAQLKALDVELAQIRRQQTVILELLRNREAISATRVMDKRRWVEILVSTGLDEAQMWRWHQEFERLAPEAHQDFLESLGLPDDEIVAIRARSSGD
jgi:MerR family transcriptional regulator, thiopeptide resistance regulator